MIHFSLCHLKEHSPRVEWLSFTKAFAKLLPSGTSGWHAIIRSLYGFVCMETNQKMVKDYEDQIMKQNIIIPS